MQLSNAPGKLLLPFANSGAKNTIPTASQIGITPGAASLTDGFPPLTRTPLAAGGVPPSGLDMNGILFELSAILRWANAGGGYAFDGTFAADSNVGGYPKGARVMRSDGRGYWFNTTDNNTTDPENVTAGVAAAAGWVPDYTNGVTAVTMTSANVTLTPAQYGKPIIVISGTLTANLNLIFPNIAEEWTVINSTTGAFTITCKTAAGTGVVVNTAALLVGDGTNIASAIGDAGLKFSAATRAYSSGTALTMTVADLGASIEFDGNIAQSAVLPPTGGCPVGASIRLVSGNASNDVTITSSGGATNLDTMGGLRASMVLKKGEDVIATWTGFTWMCTGTYVFRLQQFVNSNSANGYQKLPSGLIVQWGQGVISAAANTVVASSLAYPIVFPNAVLNSIACAGNNQASHLNLATHDSYNYPLTDSGSRTNFGFSVCSGINITNYKFRFIAIGY